MRAVNHLAAKKFHHLVDRNDQRAAEPAERSVEVGLLSLECLFRKHQVHTGFVTEWPRQCADTYAAPSFPFAFKDPVRKASVAAGPGFLLVDAGASRPLEQRHTKRTSATGKHFVGLHFGWLRLPIQRDRPAASASPVRAGRWAAEHRAPAPALQCLSSPVFLH